AGHWRGAGCDWAPVAGTLRLAILVLPGGENRGRNRFGAAGVDRRIALVVESPHPGSAARVGRRARRYVCLSGRIRPGCHLGLRRSAPPLPGLPRTPVAS